MRASSPLTLAVTVVGGITVAAGALALSEWLAAVSNECTWLPHLLWPAGPAWIAVVGLSAGALALTFHTDHNGPAVRSSPAWNTIVFGSFSLAIIIGIWLSIDAMTSGIVLAYYGGLWLMGDYLLRLSLMRLFARRRWQGRTRPEAAGNGRSVNQLPAPPTGLGLSARVAQYFQAAPPAVFVFSAMFLLAIAAINLTTGRAANAERMGNWVYGLLVVGVSVAVINRLTSSTRIGLWFMAARFRLAPLWLAALLGTVGYVLATVDNLPYAQRPAYVSAAAYLNERVNPTDVILAQGMQAGLRCFGVRSGSLFELAPEANRDNQIVLAITGHGRAYFVYAPNSEGVVRAERFAFELNGDLVARRIDRLGVETYAIKPPETLETAPAVNANFGQLGLMSEAHTLEVRSGSALAVRIELVLNVQDGQDYRANLVALDDQGQAVAVAQDAILNSAGVPTSHWHVGDQAVDHLLLPLPLGTPPLTYALALGFWSGENSAALGLLDRPGLGANRLLPLGRFSVERPSDFGSDPYGTIPALDLSALDRVWDNVRLLGYRQPAGVALPGDWLHLLLRWQTMQASPAIRAKLRLLAGARVLAQDESILGGAAYPASLWQTGEQVLDRVSIQLPPDAAPGAARVQLAVGQSEWLNLGAVTVQPITRTFTTPSPRHSLMVAFGPVAELVGYEVGPATDKSTRLTLFWRAINQSPLPVRYKVFVHALAANGDLLAQSDTEPAAWTRPTTSWIAGETIIDGHPLALPGAPNEVAAFRVGMYESDSLQRLPVGNGDFLVLSNRP